MVVKPNLMRADVMVAQNPIEEVNKLLSRAFNRSSKDRREALRAVQRVLRLAKERGFNQSDDFLFYLRHTEQHNQRATRKWLTSLFEYVSADEICRLAQLGGF